MYELTNVSSLMKTERNSHDIRSIDIHDYLYVVNPEIVIHLAAQPLVLESYLAPYNTFNVNVMGTLTLLHYINKIKDSSLKVLLNVTTDKVYDNQENQGISYRETDPLMGYDPYSASKVCSEIITDSYFKSFLSQRGIRVATARAGNVIGGGDFSDNRIIPDFIRSIQNNTEMVLRNPNSVRPWQFVLEPLVGYLLLCQHLYYKSSLSGAWNFGPNVEDTAPVHEIIEKLSSSGYFDRCVAKNESSKLHEFSNLNLDSTKAKVFLGWKPRYKLDKTINSIYNWYQCYLTKDDLLQETKWQIEDYLTYDEHDDC
jgi:CDP-glucose 4,6-dehydratase